MITQSGNSATETLRAMLDERGVEHGGSCAVVYFEDVRGYKACAYDAPHRYGYGVLCVSHTATPEQAIEATLGRGECELTMDGTDGCFGCSECLENIPPLANYCPNCGRKVRA